jgi:RNase H-fold protein (predicted Holliday junction resolvase)
MLVGFDPGRDKCGVAIATAEGTIHQRAILPAADVETQLTNLCQEQGIDLAAKSSPHVLVMGNRTTARQWQQRLVGAFPHLTIVLVDEHFSSQEARQRYWQFYPPQGWQRLLPEGLRVPPRPIDDIVAVILIERYRQHMEEQTELA